MKDRASATRTPRRAARDSRTRSTTPETDEAKRTELYQEANRQIMTILPGVPYAHNKPALAFQANVSGYVPSPVDLQSFATVSVG